MKIEMHEYDTDFCINLIPENEKEIGLLVRLGMNAKQSTIPKHR